LILPCGEEQQRGNSRAKKLFFKKQTFLVRVLPICCDEEPTADGKPQKIFPPKSLAALSFRGGDVNGTFNYPKGTSSLDYFSGPGLIRPDYFSARIIWRPLGESGLQSYPGKDEATHNHRPATAGYTPTANPTAALIDYTPGIKLAG